MIEDNKNEVRSGKGLALFFVIWTLVPAGLALLVIRLFDQLSKRDLLTVLLLCLAALILVVGGGMVMIRGKAR